MIPIVWGARLLGKVDCVPGMFHVATMFAHLYYIPLIPMQSYVVFSEPTTTDSLAIPFLFSSESSEFQGIPIPLHAKSLRWLGFALVC